ncbi:MAG: ABC transporter substrate-binding protein [Deltaproteobacteria bacterium]|jgi:ABC-type nitrate/sulfonate/bicarbonate transport system substrate-binding protein|nr:ABC transporter substrate-binding protein [Deltaproteobacteria bacterium]
MSKTLSKILMACFLLLVLGLTGSLGAQEKPLVHTSAQPALHGMPIWHATETGKIDRAPFRSDFTLFASGGPQVEALAAGQWDVGAMGAVPTILAGIRYGYKFIAISNDESETNDLWARPDSPLLKTKGANPNYPEIYGTKDDWKGKKILATTVSTGHYALSSTLKAVGLSDADVSIIHMEQAQAVTAFGAGEGDILQLWAPFSYIAEAKGWIKVSSGAKAGSIILGGVGARKEFAEQHPELVVAWLDVYISEIEALKSDPEGSVAPLLKYFTDYCGLELTAEQVKLEFKYRPLFTAEEQLELLTNPEKVPAWLDGTARFLLEQGRISQEEYDSYKNNNYFIDASFLEKLVQAHK